RLKNPKRPAPVRLFRKAYLRNHNGLIRIQPMHRRKELEDAFGIYIPEQRMFAHLTLFLGWPKEMRRKPAVIVQPNKVGLHPILEPAGIEVIDGMEERASPAFEVLPVISHANLWHIVRIFHPKRTQRVSHDLMDINHTAECFVDQVDTSFFEGRKVATKIAVAKGDPRLVKGHEVTHKPVFNKPFGLDAVKSRTLQSFSELFGAFEVKNHSC